MNKLFRRFVAYMIDMMVVLLIVECLSGIPQINIRLDKYKKYSNEYLEVYTDYVSFKTDLKEAYEDSELSIDEYESLVKDNGEYANELAEYYIEGKLTSDNYNTLNERIDTEYNNTYKELYYKIECNSIIKFIIYLVVVLAYFVGFNMFTNGQTLGKKLMRLRIINSKGNDVLVWSYIVRTLVLYQPIYYLVRLVGVSLFDMNLYYEVTNVIYNIQGWLEMLIIAMIMIRIDGRGPQDILSMTRVALYDKNGSEVKDKLDILAKAREEFKENKTIDEEPTE